MRRVGRDGRICKEEERVGRNKRRKMKRRVRKDEGMDGRKEEERKGGRSEMRKFV